ncbi:MAG: TSUP family transporter [Desulfobacterales bacterium]|nr:TSUP family transporter [Desulfobacterales bacterium]
MKKLKLSLKFILILLFIGAYSTFGDVPDKALMELQENINQAISRAKYSIITVKAQKKSPKDFGNDFIWYESIGSGVIVDEKGFAITNFHVIEDAFDVYVLLRNNLDKLPAKIIDSDKALDLALLKIESNENFNPVFFGDSDKLHIGDLVICVGSPFGFRDSVTMGIISDVSRTINVNGILFENMIQTDAVINQGNSGGPLIDISGRVIGIGTAIYAPDGTYTGIGFAIPIKRAIHFFSRFTGAVQAAAFTQGAKEPINLNKRMPNDATHKEFSNCLECHTISQKMVVNLNATMTHEPIGVCDDCHIFVKEPVAQGPIAVSLNRTTNIPQSNPIGLKFFSRSFLLMLLGIFVGTFGTMLGVGGGFIHVPFLMLVCGFSVQCAIGTSIGIIFFNTIAGSFTYYYEKRIDIHLAKKLALAVIPGAILGPLIVQKYTNSVFLFVFSIFLLLISSYLFFRNSSLMILSQDKYNRNVIIKDRDGNISSYSTNLELGYAGTFIIGFLSNLIGIGGGIIHVPFLILFLRVPVHVALGTSHFVLCVSSFVGMLIFMIMGNINIDYMMPIAIGSIIGAKIGVDISRVMSSTAIRKTLAITLFLVALKIFIKHITTVMP